MPVECYDQRLKQAKPVSDAIPAWANTRTAAENELDLYRYYVSQPLVD